MFFYVLFLYLYLYLCRWLVTRLKWPSLNSTPVGTTDWTTESSATWSSTRRSKPSHNYVISYCRLCFVKMFFVFPKIHILICWRVSIMPILLHWHCVTIYMFRAYYLDDVLRTVTSNEPSIKCTEVTGPNTNVCARCIRIISIIHVPSQSRLTVKPLRLFSI